VSATSSAGKPWGGKTPRRWQAEAFPAVRAHLSAGVLDGSVVYACTGSGKSIFAAEVLAELIIGLPPRGTIIVSTPTVALVDQLYATLAARLASCTVRGRPPTIGRY
jgi:superfamily II DNA or RNA helicase